MGRELEPGIANRAADAVPALPDARIGKTNHGERRKPERDVHLDVHRGGVDAKDRRRSHTCQHASSLVQAWILAAFVGDLLGVPRLYCSLIHPMKPAGSQ